jgi:cytochrome c oxidase subunit 3
MPGTTTLQELELAHGGMPPAGKAGGRGDDPDHFGGRARIPARAYYTGMSLGLVGILMLFTALVSSYMVRKTATAGDWQPVELPRLLWLNSAVLLVSSVTIERARLLLKASDAEGFRKWWGVTTSLGLLFVAGQVTAWAQLAASGVFVSTNPSSSFFYVFTGLHGLHLLGGITALLYVTFRNFARARTTLATAAEVTSIYWHFMDGLWIFLLLLLYLGR